MAQLDEMESWGINYIRLNFPSIGLQTQFAEQLLPELASEVSVA